MYSLKTNSQDKLLSRCTLPVRDVALSPDGNWAAVASDELAVKVVNTKDITEFFHLRDQPKPVKHLSYSPSGSHLAVSCSDGLIYVYSMSTEKPDLIKKVDGLTRALETTDEASSKVAWHPDERVFAAPTGTRDIGTMSWSDWERQRSFTSGHQGDVTALAWSPNGAMLATAGGDRKVLLWETEKQTIIARYDYANVMAMAWHPSENTFSFTNSDGELFIYNKFVPEDKTALLKSKMHLAPFIHDPLTETNGNARKPLVIGQRKRQGTPDSLDDILGLGPDAMEEDEEDDFVVDDDGAGYSTNVNGNGKRPFGQYDTIGLPEYKRPAPSSTWKPKIHEAFQPGSTPWRGNRKYLCLNLIGFVWTVDQETHHTVTVEFYDQEYYRNFHFTDPFLYDKACLNEHGTLFSCPEREGNPAMIYYRPHETWTARTDWRTSLPANEEVTSISLSESYITVTTSENYVRVYTLFGTPFRVYRQKNSPTVTCASWRDYVFTMGNGAVGGDGITRLTYTIENIKRDEVCQNEDSVALLPGSSVKSVFFSDNGDPCIYDSNGVLLVLLHWRTPGQAKWVPVLDTKKMERLASGRKEESYFPVAVARDKFHCIILKGGDQYPYFPRPLLSEFDFKIPVSDAPKVDEEGEMVATGSETSKLEEQFLRNSLMMGLLSDLLSSTTSTSAQNSELSRKEVDVDKVLLQLLAVECREGEERGMKALEIVGLMRDKSGRMLEAAMKVANRYGRSVLEEKIRELGEQRMMEADDWE
jgi:chromosome transmission fidelity protein 4